MAKFHEKAIAIYGIAQIAEGNSAIKAATDTTGTVTTSLAANTITGTAAAFLTELTIGAYLYDNTGAEVGQIDTVTDDNTATLTANGLVAISGATFATGLGAKNALAVLNLNYSTELDTEAFIYVGDELNRDEDTVIKDKFAQFDFETFLPKLGTIAGSDPVESEVPMVDWMGGCGMATLLSTGSAGFATFTNSLVANDYLTIEIRRSTPDLVTDKVYTLEGCRGLVDLDMQIGTRAKLKFNFNGNLIDVVQKDPLVADFAQQKFNIAPSAKSTTITRSELVVYVDANEPALTEVTNFCFDKLSAPNLSGFELDRFLTSCEDGWSKGAIPSDVNVTIIEDEAGAIYNPDNELEKNNVAVIRFGSIVGSRVELFFHKIQLANVVNSTVAKFTGQDLSYRNVGITDIKLS